MNIPQSSVSLLLGLLMLADSGCATQSEIHALGPAIAPDTKMQLDIFEAAIRSRLALEPLARHKELNLYFNGPVLPQLAARFPEYRVVLHDGGPRSSPPHARYYWVHLGRVTQDTASMLLGDPIYFSEGALSVDLIRQGHRWIVTKAEVFLVG